MTTPTIRDIWLGNVSESEHMPTSPEYRRLNNLADRRRAELQEQLPEQYHQLLEGYTDTMYELSAVYGEDAFVCGVRFGLRLAGEALTK